MIKEKLEIDKQTSEEKNFLQIWMEIFFLVQKQSSWKYTNHTILSCILSCPRELFFPWQWPCHSPRPDWIELKAN